MLQNIIVYIIIALAIAYTAYSVFKSITKKEKSGCDGCNGCDIKREITQHKGNSSTISCGCDSK